MKNRKIYALLLLLTFTSSLFYQCIPDNEYRSVEKLNSNFSKEAEQWGNIIAELLISSAHEIESSKIRLTDRDAVNLIAKKNTLNTFEKNGYITKKEKKTYLMSKTELTGQQNVSLSEIINSENINLSKEQIKFLKRIENARKNSTSYIRFSNKLVRINEDIYSKLPLEEQQPLILLTSTLFYGLEAINSLVTQGKLPGIPENNNITLALLEKGSIQMANAQSEADDDESWWDSWGKCVAGTIGDAITYGVAGCAAGGAVGGTVGAGVGSLAGGVGALPGAAVGAGAGCVAGGVVGAIGGALSGAADHCD